VYVANQSNANTNQQQATRADETPTDSSPTPAVTTAAPSSESSDIDLSQIPADQQINFLAEKIYGKIVALHPEQAPKITGMLLEQNNTAEQLLSFLKDESHLKSKVDEALALLMQPPSTTIPSETPASSAQTN